MSDNNNSNKQATLIAELRAKLSDAKSRDERKTILGEELYYLVSRHTSAHRVSKITGMLLELDDEEVLNLIADDVNLRCRVDESVAVLQAASNLAAAMAPPAPAPLPMRDNRDREYEERKDKLGEQLFFAISVALPEAHDRVAKITGMLLEFTNDEIEQLLGDPGLLAEKIAEAKAVLRDYGM